MKETNEFVIKTKLDIINAVKDLGKNGIIAKIYLNEKLVPAINDINDSSDNAIESLLMLLKGQTNLPGKRNLIFIVSQHLKDCEESYNSFFNQQKYQAITKSCKDFLQHISGLEDSTRQVIKTNKVEVSIKNN